jgi:hypothetical protein
MARRECPFCGKHVSDHLTQCVFCRETLPELKKAANAKESGGDGGGAQVRRGLLAMLLAAVLGYFGGGYSALALPFPLDPILTIYLSPLLFLSGLGLCVHGYFLEHRSMHHKSSMHSSNSSI